MIRNRSKQLFARMRKSSLFGAIAIVIVLLGVMLIIKPTYLSATNVHAIVKVLTITALIGFSQMIIIGSGGMNVSVGTTGALCAIISGCAMEVFHLPAPLAALIGMLTGLICGVINGLLIYRAGGVGIAFFLTTLATSSIFQGINLTITSGNPYYDIAPEFFAYGDTSIVGIPLSFWIMIVVGILLSILFSRKNIGRQILAYGANPRAAMLYGISKLRVMLVSNMLAGAVASIAGMLAMIRIQAAQPNMGSDWMLMSFASTLIGGTSLAGGKVSVAGTVIGALALTIVTNGLVHLRINVYWNTLIYGLVILLAVTIDRLRYIRRR